MARVLPDELLSAVVSKGSVKVGIDARLGGSLLTTAPSCSMPEKKKNSEGLSLNVTLDSVRAPRVPRRSASIAACHVSTDPRPLPTPFFLPALFAFAFA